MFATIRRYRILGSVESGLNRVQAEFVPMIQRIPGLVSFDIMVAGETWASVSVFEDAHAAEESNRIAALWAQKHLSDVLEMPAQISAGEVFVHVRPELHAHA